MSWLDELPKELQNNPEKAKEELEWFYDNAHLRAIRIRAGELLEREEVDMWSRELGNFGSEPLSEHQLWVVYERTTALGLRESAGLQLTRIFNLMYELQTIQRPSASLLIGARAR